jgi:hypothetical protein
MGTMKTNATDVVKAIDDDPATTGYESILDSLTRVTDLLQRIRSDLLERPGLESAAEFGTADQESESDWL